MKILTICFFFFLHGLSLCAQSADSVKLYFGLGFGVSAVSVYGSGKSDFHGDFGYSARLIVGRAIWKNVLFLQPEVGLSNVNASGYNFTDPLFGIHFHSHSRLHVNVIESSLLLRGKMTKSFDAFAGVSLRKRTGGSLTRDDGIQDKISKIQWAIPIGICWVSKQGLLIETRYTYGLSSIAQHTVIKTNALILEISLSNLRLVRDIL